MARKLIQAAIGPRARIWPTPDGYELGLDKQPGRAILAYGVSVDEVLQKAFDPTNQQFGRPKQGSDQPQESTVTAGNGLNSSEVEGGC